MKVTISKAHVRIYRAVEGAVLNAAHGHPNWNLNKTMARSIAKRATGTLTADWPDVLAALTTPSDANGHAGQGHWPPSRRANTARVGGGRRYDGRRSPFGLGKLAKQLGIMAREARRAEQFERLDAIIEVLRLVARLGTHGQ